MDWLSNRFELSRSFNANNIQPMEGLRGFAVFLVFLVHYVTIAGAWVSKESESYAIALALQSVSYSGVDLFFVLSGYLIYGSLISRESTHFFRFIWRRIQRIYPTFIFVFILYIILSWVFPSESKVPEAPTAGLIYLAQNFFLLPGLFPIKPMIDVAWSLSYEMLYYFVIPLIITLFKLRDYAPIWRVTFFIALSIIISVCTTIMGGSPRIIMFISGILLYEAMGHHRIPTPQSSIGLLALIVGLLALVPHAERPESLVVDVYILFLTFFILCLACFRNPRSWLSCLVAWTPLRWLGNMSYSYYLLHGLALKALFLVLSVVIPMTIYGDWFFWVLLPMMFGLTLIPSAV
ncbi:MAG: acyltransferase, partial [Nitrospirota bacterium]